MFFKKLSGLIVWGLRTLVFWLDFRCPRQAKQPTVPIPHMEKAGEKAIVRLYPVLD
jgi:hypothetical protein